MQNEKPVFASSRMVDNLTATLFRFDPVDLLKSSIQNEQITLEIFLDGHYKSTVEKLGFLYFLLARDTTNQVSHIFPLSRTAADSTRADDDSFGRHHRFHSSALPRPSSTISRDLEHHSRRQQLSLESPRCRATPHCLEQRRRIISEHGKDASRM